MTARTCAIPGCERPAVARGMCNAHYARARREGRERFDGFANIVRDALKASRNGLVFSLREQAAS